jgi:hypothetical protein
LIVPYVGEDQAVTALVEVAVGAQLAGGKSTDRQL